MAMLIAGMCANGYAAGQTDAAEGRQLPGPSREVQKMAETRGMDQWPCLSRNLPCGKIPTRPVVKKRLSGELNGDAERGREIALTRQCIACHHFEGGGEQTGAVGPDLSRFGQRYSESTTYMLIYDMRTRNPDTVMPPFGTNEILSDQEIRDLVAYLRSL